MTDDAWDAVVVGAGPAGSVAAFLLARRGWRVLLIEKSSWPREKVCGGCVNAAAAQLLKEMGLGQALEGEVAALLTRFALNVRGERLTLELPGGVAIARQALDRRLVDAAVAAGAIFRSGCAAHLLHADRAVPFRTIRAGDETLRTKVAIACDGVAGIFLEQEPWATWDVAAASWFGVSTTLDSSNDSLACATIGMNIGDGGYVGTARLAGHGLHVAAALDADICRAHGGPARHIAHILEACDHPLADAVASARFRGTGLLTRRRNALGGYRVLAAGDACGYVEPFTGEGIAWAIRGASELVRLLPASLREWPDDIPMRWRQAYAVSIEKQQRLCRVLRHLVRRPVLASAGVRAARIVPSIAAAIARHVGQQSFFNSQPVEGVGA